MRTGVFAAFSGGKIFSGFPEFSALTQRGARTALACSPFPGGSFSAPTQRGTRTALAGSPFPGGEFFAEPQQGGFAVCGRRERAAPRGGDDAVPTAVGKKEGTPTVSLPL